MRGSSDMEWSDEAIARLRVLWDEGHSTAEIGRKLGCSKNAVIGKAHRIDLPTRPSPVRQLQPGEQPKRVKAHVPVKRSLPALPSLQGPPVNVVPMRSAPRPKRVAPRVKVVEQVGPVRVYCKDCQWVESTKPVRFCDKPAERGSYCSGHAQIAYRRPEKAAA
jgi:GcrA cell cycle regulator